MSDLVMQGLELAAVGMGFVFSFLILLVFLTATMSRVVLRFDDGKENDPEFAGSGARSTGKSGSPASDAARSIGIPTRTVAIISSAIMQHRQHKAGTSLSDSQTHEKDS